MHPPASPPLTPTISAATDTSPSFAPSTIARSQGVLPCAVAWGAVVQAVVAARRSVTASGVGVGAGGRERGRLRVGA